MRVKGVFTNYWWELLFNRPTFNKKNTLFFFPIFFLKDCISRCDLLFLYAVANPGNTLFIYKIKQSG